MIDEMKEILILTPDDLIERTKSIESLIRKSPEYRQYLKYIKEDLRIRSCDFFKQVDFVEKDLSVEVHHLITLYNIVQIAGTKLLLENKNGILPIDVVKEVIHMHLDNLVPTILLSKTVHELYHADLYQLDKKSNSINLGNYEKFIKKYAPFLTQNDIAMITYFDIIDNKTKESIETLWLNARKDHQN